MLSFELGSLAEWFSGILTAFAVFLALKENRVNIKVKDKFYQNHLEIIIINKSNFDIELDLAYVALHKKKFKKSYITEYNEHFFEDNSKEPKQITLKRESSEKVSFDLTNELESNKKAFYEYSILYNNGLIKKSLYRRRARFNDF